MKRIQSTTSVVTFFLISIIITALTFFFLEQSIIAETTPGYYFDPLSMANQIFIAMVIVTLVTVFLVYFITRVRLSISRILISILLIVTLVIGTVNILTMAEVRIINIQFLDGSFNDITLTLPFDKRITALLTLYVNIAFMFFIIVVLPNHRHFLKLILFLIFTIVLIALAAVAFSLVTEWDKYLYIIEHGYTRSSVVPESFFGNRNPYASFLLNAQILLLFYYYLTLNYKRRFIYIILQIPIIIAIFFTFSKTNILLSIFVAIIVYYNHLIRLFRNRKFKWFAVSFILSTQIILFFVSFRFFPAFANNDVHTFLVKFFPNTVVDAGTSTFKSRINLWRYAWTLVLGTPMTFFFGDGPHISRYFYYSRMSQEISGVVGYGMGDYHNGFIEVLHTFGMFGLLFYVGIIITTIVFVVKRIKTSRNLSFFMAVAFIVFILRSQTESLVALMFKSEGILASFTYILPFLYLMKLSHRFGFGKQVRLKRNKKKLDFIA